MELQDYFQQNANNLNKVVKTENELKRSNTELMKVKKRGNFILRQELKDYTPECNYKCSIFINVLFSIIFLSIGTPIILSSENILETKVQYDTW